MELLPQFENFQNIQQGPRQSGPHLARRVLTPILALGLFFVTCPGELSAFQDQDTQASAQDAEQGQAADQTAAPAPQTPEQLQQLVAPIALYPDSLVAQILAASTYPAQVVEADRWVQAHPDLKGDDLARAVDQQSWDPSVKALTAFPSVLGNMDKNISWTSSLGDAYFNQEQDVTDAIQTMRQKAEQAGNLKSTPQEDVTTQDSTIAIQPTNPEVVYVPAYDPWLVYGYPVVAWPGWYPYPGIWYGGPSLFWGPGFGIGFFGGYGWGWGHWGYDWHRHYAIYNHDRYYSRSTTFYNRGNYYRGGRGGVAYGHPGVPNRPFNGNERAARGYEPGRSPGGRPGGPPAAGNRPSGPPPGEYRGGASRGTQSGAFSGYGHGGQARSEASRGRASMGGGGFRGGGGGGGRGGGGGGGGRRR
ncbi:MAG: DUF3300 domain-containing protein [Candidatus Acidiferrales bacterium]